MYIYMRIYVYEYMSIYMHIFEMFSRVYML